MIKPILKEFLQKFCDEGDEHLEVPFSIGEWTYATDRRIIIRVPRVEWIMESSVAPQKPAELFKIHDENVIGFPLSFGDFEDHKSGNVLIGNKVIAPYYAELICSLAGFEASKVGNEKDALVFRFIGGQGLLMPLRL